jgi:hypothetical protein
VADGQAHYGFLAALIPFQDSGNASFMHYRDAIAFAENLFHVAADHDNGYSAFGQASHQLVDFGFCSNVDSARGFVKY